MHTKGRFRSPMLGSSLHPESATFAIVVMLLFLLFVLLFMTFTAQPVQGQTFKVIYNFTGGADGRNPLAGLTMDSAGNLYGTAQFAGFRGTPDCANSGCGTIFQLKKQGSGWMFTPLYLFKGKPDGASPAAALVFGPDGSLYGTTVVGGSSNCISAGCGTVFTLTPDLKGGWTESVLYRFTGFDGLDPDGSPTTFDAAGAIYLTTRAGGTELRGSVVKLTAAANGWTCTVLHSFTRSADGMSPRSGVIFDAAGNLYGAAAEGGNRGCGNIFELTPSGAGWTESILYNFQCRVDGELPIGGLIFDQSGNLYGSTWGDGNLSGPDGSGTVFMLSPSRDSWTLTGLYSVTSYMAAGPWASLARDEGGNLFGTTTWGGNGCGSVFKLTRSVSGWTYSSMHDFACGIDGRLPFSSVVLDKAGNLYGTASGGGFFDRGVVFEITP